ncbi:MAG: hypothetical protein WC612_08780 [Bdellovibrionales bacterium]|jgi:predicted secreted protein
MKHTLVALMLILGFTVGIGAPPAHAEEAKPDDSVVFDLSAEQWVTTKTARVMLSVEAAVTNNTAGTMRASMTKAVGDMVKADWRVVSFNRGQDQTGMERWSALYEARVPENELSGLSDKAKQNSKAGMQITVNNIDFSPTLEENQAATGQLRTQLYKMANEQLSALNATITGRSYRIAMIDFANEGMPHSPRPAMFARGKAMMHTMEAMAGGSPDGDSMPPMERSEKLLLTARVVLSAVPPAASK